METFAQAHRQLSKSMEAARNHFSRRDLQLATRICSRVSYLI